MAIKLTEKAAQEIKGLMTHEIEENNMSINAVLRLLVVGGGCSGLAYRMGFDENVTPEDRVEEILGVKLAVDQRSHVYLNGTEVDFHEGAMGRGFVFNNPNAITTCGCGHSAPA